MKAKTGKKYRAALIGWKGNYGHGFDLIWNGLDSVEVAAVADQDDMGRKKAISRSSAKRGYGSYHEMLQKEKPDLVCICTRRLAERLEMVTAAAEIGAHIVIEKPFVNDLAKADGMVKAVERNRVKLLLGHPWRISLLWPRLRDMIFGGEIGVLQEIRTRGKEDLYRAGGQDLLVLGSHMMDLMRMCLGDPLWCFGHVTHKDQDINRIHVIEAVEPAWSPNPHGPVGTVAGDQVAAMFYFYGGIHGYFSSKSTLPGGGWKEMTDKPETVPGETRFGMWFYGSKGIIALGRDHPNKAYILRSSDWHSGEWEKIEPRADEVVEGRGVHLMALELINAIEQDRETVCNARDGRWTVDMIMSIYESQRTKAPVDLPLKSRRNPLDMI